MKRTFLATLFSASFVLTSISSASWIKTLDGGVRLYMDQPAGEEFNRARPTLLIIYATPNGSTIEDTLGGPKAGGQQIAAQTTILRKINRRENIVLAVVQASQKSWPAFRKAYADSAQRERQIVATAIKETSNTGVDRIYLTGHSGGGSFLFGYINSADEIFSKIQRIAFLDANYSYSDDDKHGEKLLAWLRGDKSRMLVVIAYDDRNITFNGKKVVGPDGGTFRASHRMLDRFSEDLKLQEGRLSPFDTFIGMDGQIRFFIHPNSENKILHTLLVGEMNGYLQAMTVGTPEETKWGRFGGPPASTQPGATSNSLIPARPANAVEGSKFANQLGPLPIDQRESRITSEILHGNIPNFLRQFTTIRISSTLSDGRLHTADVQVMPDYLSIGSDDDFMRIPMTPMTARKIADAFGCVLPTRKLVNDVYQQATIKLEPRPLTEKREAIQTFLEHNRIIEQQRHDSRLGQLIAGIKKDVVLTNKLNAAPGHVAIYGWHLPDGKPIQPLTTVHKATYVDYSHGVRLIARQLIFDGVPTDVSAILDDPMLCPMLSDEGPMKISTMYASKSQ